MKMETIMTIPTIEAPPALELPLPMRVTGSIFLPMFTSRSGVLHVITMQTYGRQMRYFTNPNEPALQYALHYVNGAKNVKRAEAINLGEFYTWEVSYFKGNSASEYYLNIVNGEDRPSTDFAVVSTPIVKIDELFKLNAPLEFKAAVLNVAFKELGKI